MVFATAMPAAAIVVFLGATATIATAPRLVAVPLDETATELAECASEKLVLSWGSGGGSVTVSERAGAWGKTRHTFATDDGSMDTAVTAL